MVTRPIDVSDVSKLAAFLRKHRLTLTVSRQPNIKHLPWLATLMRRGPNSSVETNGRGITLVAALSKAIREYESVSW